MHRPKSQRFLFFVLIFWSRLFHHKTNKINSVWNENDLARNTKYYYYCCVVKCPKRSNADSIVMNIQDPSEIRHIADAFEDYYYSFLPYKIDSDTQKVVRILLVFEWFIYCRSKCIACHRKKKKIYPKRNCSANGRRSEKRLETRKVGRIVSIAPHSQSTYLHQWKWLCILRNAHWLAQFINIYKLTKPSYKKNILRKSSPLSIDPHVYYFIAQV